MRTLPSCCRLFSRKAISMRGGATTVFLERIYKYAFVQYKMGMASTYACILFVVLLLFTAVQFWMQKRWVNYDA